MAFRYRILFYHENQNWAPKIAPLLDLPLFHVLTTDSDTVVQKHLESGEVDIILTGMNTQHFLLVPDENNSLTYKQALLWQAIEEQRTPCQVILLCTQKELSVATGLVQSGKVADYFIVSPMLDKARLFISIMRVVESGLMRSLLEKNLLGGEKLPVHLLESVELLQDIRDTQDAVLAPPPPMNEPPPQPPDDLASEFATFAADPVPEPAPAAEPDLWGGFSTFPEPSSSGSDSTFSADSVFASLAPATEESAFGASSVFASLNDDPPAPPVAPFPMDTGDTSGFELPDLHGAKKPGGGTLAHSWSRMQRSEFEILLVDHDRENIEVVQDTVEAMGFRVLVVHSGEEALDLLNREEFQLLLVNRDLPDQDGLEFVNKIRYKGPQSAIPAIVLSSGANEEHVIKSIKVGANYFIVKPINPDRLMRHVFELVPRD